VGTQLFRIQDNNIEFYGQDMQNKKQEDEKGTTNSNSLNKIRLKTTSKTNKTTTFSPPCNL